MNKNVPKLRFKEFEGEWKRRILGDLIIEKTQKTDDKGKYPLYSLTIESGVIPKSERYEREFLVKKEGNFKIVDNNDFVYNPMNLRFGALASYKGEFPVSVSGYYNIFTFKNSGLEKFWECYLKTNKMMYLYNTIATGSLEEKKRVHYSQFKELKLPLPTLQEQEKIADFFTILDSLIEEQDGKVSDLELYKKGMMQKIFSQEIRFKDENGCDYPDWKKQKLGDISRIIMGQSPSSIAYNENNEGIPLVQGNADIINRLTTPRIYTSEITKTCELKDIIMSVRAPVGTIAIANQVCCIGRGVCAIKSNSNQNYLYQVLLEQESKWSKISQGSTFESINSNDIKNLIVKIPSLQEQKKIADFLFNIDNLIEKEKKNLDDLREMKKGLLQQMFV